MRPIRLAVLFDQRIRAGGGYQQSLNAALLTHQLSSTLIEPVFLATHPENIEALTSYGVDATLLHVAPLSRLFLRLRRLIKHQRLLVLLKKLKRYNAFENQLLAHKVDLVYFLSPSGLAIDLEQLNYITTVWDLCHREDLEFPEVRCNRSFENRETNYQSILPRAIAVLVDSELGRNNVAHRYAIDIKRIYVMPFGPAQGTRLSVDAYQAGYIEIAKKYALDVPYVFYPAQFWAHKNHVYLLEGLKELEQYYGHRLGAIFAGGDQGNMAFVRQRAEALGIAERIRFAGFVPNEEMPYLYCQSVALVMPTYFGPTNLPPLEAFALGVPVLYPDKEGLRDQVGNAALLMDLSDPDSMARHLADLLSRPDLRERLVKRGKVRLQELTSTGGLRVLESILTDFQRRRACWQ